MTSLAKDVCALAGALLTIAVLSATAHARGFTPRPELAYPLEPMPANGGLLIAWSANSMPFVTVSSFMEPGVVIEGAVTQLSQLHWVWTPAAPLSPGVHEVTLGGWAGDTGIRHTITVAEPVELGAPPLSAVLELARFEDPVEDTCCLTYDSAGVSERCATTKVSIRTELRVVLQSTLPRESIHQYVFRVVPVQGIVELEEPAAYPLDVVRDIRIDQQADAYCIRVDAVEIASQRVHSDRVGERCMPNGPLAPVGERVLDVEDAFLEHAVCHSPPLLLQSRWCTLNDAPCTAASAPESCALYGHRCLGEPRPEQGAIADGEQGGAAGMNASGDAELQRPAKAGTACSTSQPRAAGSGAAWSAALLASVLGLGRRRRRLSGR